MNIFSACQENPLNRQNLLPHVWGGRLPCLADRYSPFLFQKQGMVVTINYSFVFLPLFLQEAQGSGDGSLLVTMIP